jgi:cysteine desulfurase
MIYFDNSATTKPFPEVVDSFVKVSSDFFGNPSSIHRLGVEAESLLAQARKQIGELLHVNPSEVYFTSGGTESNNLAIKGTALMYRSRGKHIITSAVEHASVREAFQQLKELGFRITVLPVDTEGRVSISDIEAAICHDTILVSIMHVNNEVGAIQPIEEIGNLLKGYSKILFHVDYVQGVGKVALEIQKHQIDLCSISAHKFHGLKGTGVLVVRKGVQISPLFSGGNQEWKLRSGTENVAGAVSMAKALRLTLQRYETKLSYISEVQSYLLKELQKLEDVVIHTPCRRRAPHIINFSVKGFRGEVFVHALEEKGLIVSTTSACSSKMKAISHTLLAMNVSKDVAESAIRMSLSYENTLEEAKKAILIIQTTVTELREVMH